MSNLFSTKGVSEEGKKGNGQQYIYGGVYNKVNIKSVKANSDKTPYIAIEMFTDEGGADTSREFRFYFTEKAAPVSMSKLKHIATKVVTEAEFEAIVANDVHDLARQLSDLIRGGKLRMKFTAEQYENNNGEVKDRPLIGLPPFAEAIMPGAEYPVVADDKTELTYDKNNQYDYKKLAGAAPTKEDSLEEVAQSSIGIDDL